MLVARQNLISDVQYLEKQFFSIMAVPFTQLIDLEDLDIDESHPLDKSAPIVNPNKDDNRRLFQVRNVDFSWDPSFSYELQPNRIGREGPTPLLFPDHFYEVMGGVVIIYFEKSRSTACICSIRDVVEEKEDLICRIYGWQGKSKKTFHETGKDTIIRESEVWRMVHRRKFEQEIMPR